MALQLAYLAPPKIQYGGKYPLFTDGKTET